MSKNISYLRIRPCDNDNEIYLNSRKNEGTSAFLIKEDTSVDIELIHSKEFQTISKNIEIDSDMWIVNENTFIKVYLLRGLILSGWRGLVQSVVESFYAFLKEAYLWIIERESAGPDS